MEFRQPKVQRNQLGRDFRGARVDEGTLYPLLRRLEGQGLLISHWREEDKRNKRFYSLLGDGEHVLQRLLSEWREIDSSLKRIVGDQRHGTH